MFHEALKACVSQETADKWLADEIASQAKEFNRSPEETKDIILDNLGYWSGYQTIVEARMVYIFYKAKHPFLGTPDEREKLTPAQIFKMGMEAGKDWKKGRIQTSPSKE